MFSIGKELYQEDIALLVENGFIKRDEDGKFVSATIKINDEIESELIEMGIRCRKNVEKEMLKLRKRIQELLDEGVPEHLKKMSAYGNQSIFNSEGIFIGYVGDYLFRSGKLQMPSEEQKRGAAIVQVVFNKKL